MHMNLWNKIIKIYNKNINESQKTLNNRKQTFRIYQQILQNCKNNNNSKIQEIREFLKIQNL